MTAVNDGPLNKPVPIIFTVCQGAQQLVDGTFNLLSIYDRANLHMAQDGSNPDTLTIQVFTLWTGGQGDFEQYLEVRDWDGKVAVQQTTAFNLQSTSHRHGVMARITLRAQAGVYTLLVGRPDQELLRQDFTIAVAAPANPA